MSKTTRIPRLARRRRAVAPTLVAALALLAGALAAPSATGAPAARAGTELVGDWDTAFEGTAGTPLPTTQVVPADGPGFDEALRIDVQAEPSNEHFDGEWSVATAAPTEIPLAQDDALVASFWARSVGESTGHRIATFMVEENGGTFGKSGTMVLELDETWQHFEFGFRSRAAYEAGAARVKFWLGYGEQAVELGDLSVRNLGQGQPEGFPAVTYPGREANAPWRAEARERIERHRMGDLDVQVRDADGAPVEGADVRVEMTEHAFNFGHAAGAQLLTGTGTDSDNYRDVVLTDTNQVTLDNDLKWGFWDNVTHREQYTLPAIDWLHDNDIDLHGHALVWPSWSKSPAYLQDLTEDELRTEVRAHIADEAGALADDVISWDVVNEPYSEHDITDLLGRDEIAQWFREADAVDPDATLMLNDYGLLSLRSGGHERKLDFTETLLADLREADAPIDALGMQAHVSALQPASPDRLLGTLDRLGATGLGLRVTEFDFATWDEQLQADYTRDFLTTMFSHPDVDAISSWGFWEGRYAWQSAAMYRLDWTQKPNGAAWRDLVRDAWWTDETVVSDGAGAASVPAFLGSYEISVTVDGVTTTEVVEHTSTDATSVTITL